MPIGCSTLCSGALGRRRACQGSCPGCPGSCAAQRITQVGGARSAARQLAGSTFGRGTTLGCAGQACARARGLALGARRVYPVAGDEPDAADTSRHGVQCSHLQRNARDEARLAQPNVLHGDGELGAKIAREVKRVAAATRAARLADGQACSVRGRARAIAVPKARAASPCSPGAAT
jgi:hypothetical protein